MSLPYSVHEKALCQSRDIGPNTRVWAFAHIMDGARIGSDCNICDHAFIESGAVVGNRVTVKNNVLVFDKVIVEDDVFLGPNVVFTNDLTPRVRFKKTPGEFLPTLVKTGASIGAGAVIVCGVTIGEHSLVAAGSVITSDVPPHALVMGNPARPAGWVCECGRRLPESLKCSCGRTYLHTMDGRGLAFAG